MRAVSRKRKAEDGRQKAEGGRQRAERRMLNLAWALAIGGCAASVVAAWMLWQVVF